MAIKKCRKGQCIAGIIGCKKIKVSRWTEELKNFDKVIEEWDVKNRRFQVPHPGFVHAANFCEKCGNKIVTGED